MRTIRSGLIPILVAVAMGCSRQPRTTDSPPPRAGRRAADFPTNVTEYQVRGVLREIRANGSKALIAHETIPGYMEAMTMPFEVRNTNELVGVQPGDQISFRLLVTEDDGWIDRLKRTGGSSVPPKPSAARRTTPDEELKVGSTLPDFVLTNHLGQGFHLRDFKGRALAFTFIFTRCPFPTFCPRMNSQLGAAQNQLQADPSKTNWQMVSISFDSDYDTPGRLAEYARYYHPDPTHWTFATGTTETVRKLGGGFGLRFWPEGTGFNHNLRTVVVDAGGRVQKVFTDNEWQPAELIAEMKRAMDVHF